jgi:hypothetical protein
MTIANAITITITSTPSPMSRLRPRDFIDQISYSWREGNEH